jgi:hypothetical protein
MGIRQGQTTFPVETRSVKISNYYYTKIMDIKFVFLKNKIISNDFRFSVKGKVMISNEQIKTIKSGDVIPYTFVTKF